MASNRAKGADAASVTVSGVVRRWRTAQFIVVQIEIGNQSALGLESLDEMGSR